MRSFWKCKRINLEIKFRQFFERNPSLLLVLKYSYIQIYILHSLYNIQNIIRLTDDADVVVVVLLFFAID